MSDSDIPVDRLNSKSTLSGNSRAFEVEVEGFFGLGTFSPPRWSEKSNSKSIEDSSSVSFAEDIVVQAVAELPLLSEELVARPRPRDNEEPTCWPMDPSIKPHFLLTPFAAGMSEIEEPGKSSRKTVSVPYSAPAPPTCTGFPKILNAFEV